MPRTKLANLHPTPEGKGKNWVEIETPKVEPYEEPTPNPVIEKEAPKEIVLRKVPGTPFVFDVDTGQIFLDKPVWDMLK